MRIVKLDEASMKNILADMLKRDPNNYDAYTETVQEIVDRVKAEGDAAVFDYTKKFDKAEDQCRQHPCNRGRDQRGYGSC